MPRKQRKKSETGIYHVIVRGIGQQDIFHEEDDFQRYLELQKFTEEGNEDHCLYCDKTKRINEREAYEITKIIMKGKPVTALPTLSERLRH